MPNEDGSIQVVFNGEIYNFRELREDLESRGHAFRSRSDTETIVHAYEEFGNDFVSRLDGMFAFALWDNNRRRLMLARDRSGKKPLFYATTKGRFTFGSEIKAILACPWIEPAVAKDRLSMFFSLGYVPAPDTLYNQISQVRPGNYIVFDGSTSEANQARYWDLPTAAGIDKTVGTQEAVAKVKELVREAVRKRLVSDVPLGALLSGGVDSTIIVGVMSELMNDPVRTFSLGFSDDRSYDETRYADIAARRFGTLHTTFRVRPNATSLLQTLLWHHDQPYADSSAIPTFIVSRLARDHVTVALNGDGGDEVFAGYNRFLAAVISERMPGWANRTGRALTSLLPHQDGYFNLRRRAEKLFLNSNGSTFERFIDWHRIMQVSEVLALLKPEFSPKTDVTEQYFTEVFNNAGPTPMLSKLLYAQFHSSLAGDINVKMDRMGMASGLETRSPLLDTRVMEYVAGLSPNLKVRRATTKWVLRAAFRDLLPRELQKRPKHGFSVPLAQWFRGPLREQLGDLVLAPGARSSHYLELAAVRKMADLHKDHEADYSHGLWTILNFELWLRMLESGELVSPPATDPFAAIDLATAGRVDYA